MLSILNDYKNTISIYQNVNSIPNSCFEPVSILAVSYTLFSWKCLDVARCLFCPHPSLLQEGEGITGFAFSRGRGVREKKV